MPNNAGLQNNLGVILQQVGDFVASESHCKKAVDLMESLPELQFNYANSLKKNLKYDLAIEHYLRAIELNPNFPSY